MPPCRSHYGAKEKNNPLTRGSTLPFLSSGIPSQLFLGFFQVKHSEGPSDLGSLSQSTFIYQVFNPFQFLGWSRLQIPVLNCRSPLGLLPESHPLEHVIANSSVPHDSLPGKELLSTILWPYLTFLTSRLWTHCPRKRPYGVFCSKTLGLFIGLTHLFLELLWEISNPIKGIQNQLSTKD